MSTIQVRVRHAVSTSAYADVQAVDSQTGPLESRRREITPESAVAIASWWQSPGSVGSALAAFASGCSVDRGELLNDIAFTRVFEGYYTREMPTCDRRALDCLSTFILNYNQPEV
jgi:hypothetical protein